MTGIYRKINYICLTEFNKEKLLQLNRPSKKVVIDPEKVYIKPNFTFGNNLGTQRDRAYYLFIGRVEKIKGLDVLLDAFAGLQNENLVVAGTGSQLEEYKNIASENVRFTGFLNRAELSECLMKAKAVIVPSQWYETFGMIIAEAYAAHRPVIVGDIGNIASIVDEGVTGCKFVYNSVDSLREAIWRFEKSEQLEYEDRAYQKWKNEFSPEKNYKVIMKIYEDISMKKTQKNLGGYSKNIILLYQYRMIPEVQVAA
jgi:glycosyltransferase involved in cell wall biosynthesis